MDWTMFSSGCSNSMVQSRGGYPDLWRYLHTGVETLVMRKLFVGGNKDYIMANYTNLVCIRNNRKEVYFLIGPISKILSDTQILLGIAMANRKFSLQYCHTYKSKCVLISMSMNIIANPFCSLLSRCLKNEMTSIKNCILNLNETLYSM